VRLKILFQDLCTDKVDWDESLHDEVLERWNAIVAEFSSLSCLKVPRHYYLLKSTPLTSQLHGSVILPPMLMEQFCTLKLYMLMEA